MLMDSHRAQEAAIDNLASLLVLSNSKLDLALRAIEEIASSLDECGLVRSAAKAREIARLIRSM